MASQALTIDIESEPVQRRVRQLTRDTGLTPLEIVEQAVLAFDPLPTDISPRLVSKNGILVLRGGRPITHEEVQASIDEDREARGSCY